MLDGVIRVVDHCELAAKMVTDLRWFDISEDIRQSSKDDSHCSGACFIFIEPRISSLSDMSTSRIPKRSPSMASSS